MAVSTITLAVCGIALARAQDEEPVAHFGTTVVLPSGLEGSIYHIRHNSTHLPDFKKLKRVGTIYTSELNIPPQDFQQGFPGVTKRFEWFAIDYTGRFWISKPGEYNFTLTSDDGANLYIDDNLVIDNDGEHPPATKTAMVDLKGGIHSMRVPYFQGRRFQVALVLQIAGAGEQLRIFSTEEFKPPPNPEDWKFPDTPGKQP
jgi:hypothetical protein